MSTQADGGPGQSSAPIPEDSDAIDAGWDDAAVTEAPASSGMAAARDETEAAAVQLAQPERAEPVGSMTAVPSKTSTLAAKGTKSDTRTTAANGRARVSDDDGTLRPSAVQTPEGDREARGLARFVTTLAIAAVLALVGLVALRQGGRSAPEAERGAVTHTEETPPKVAAQAPTPTEPSPPAMATDPTPAAAPASPAEATPPAAPPASSVEAAAPSEPEAKPAPTSPAAASATEVTVRSVPAGAIFFQSGRKLGVGTVTVSVEPRSKRHLTALLNGYAPMNFAVNGSRSEVTVLLKPVPRPSPAEQDVADGAQTDVHAGAADESPASNQGQ